MTDQFIIGDREEVERFARRERWREWGRASWRKPDGTEVHYLLLPEQVRGIAAGSTLHVIGFDEVDVEASGLSHLKVIVHPGSEA